MRGNLCFWLWITAFGWLLCGGGCCGAAGDREGVQEITVELDATQWPEVKFIISNAGKKPLRIWQDWNSWGWDNKSLIMVLRDGSVFHAVRKGYAFTRNFPSFDEVVPDASKTITLKLEDGSWVLPKGADLRRDVLFIAAMFHIAESKESVEHHVWTGTIVSEWVRMPEPSKK